MSIRFTITLLLAAFMITGMNAQVIWGGPGDPNGEFDGGLNDWTTVGLSSAVADSAINAVWEWDSDGLADQGLFAGGNDAIQSPSASNGAALFNSEFLDNAGVDFGTGAAPSPHSGELISPIIDCSGQESVTLTFYQDYRFFQGTNSIVAVSNDGGETFAETVINTNSIVNFTVPNKNTFYRLDISETAANSDSVVIKFIFVGDYYYWTIDDVALIVTPELDLGLNSMWYSPTYANTPISQMDAVDHEYAVEVFNLGTEDQYDVKVAVSVTDPELNTLFSDTTYIDTLMVRDTFFSVFDTIVDAELSAFSEIGDYNLIYEIFPGDDDLANRDNLVFERFSVTEDLYSVDRGIISHLSFGLPGLWWGNLYTTGSWEDSGNGAFTANKIYPSTSSTSGTITGSVFKVNADVDENFDNFDFSADITVPGEHPDLTPVGFFIHSVEGSGIQSIDLIDIDTDDAGIVLEPNTRYLYIFTTDDGMTLGLDRSIEYFQFTTFLYVPGDRLYPGGNGAINSLVAGVEIGFVSSVKEDLLPSSVLSVYPNPAQNNFQVDLEFEEATDVTLLITGVDGRIHRMENLSKVVNLSKQYQVADLANGTYIVRVLTDDGSSNQKLVIQK